MFIESWLQKKRKLPKENESGASGKKIRQQLQQTFLEAYTNKWPENTKGKKSDAFAYCNVYIMYICK